MKRGLGAFSCLAPVQTTVYGKGDRIATRRKTPQAGDATGVVETDKSKPSGVVRSSHLPTWWTSATECAGTASIFTTRQNSIPPTKLAAYNVREGL